MKMIRDKLNLRDLLKVCKFFRVELEEEMSIRSCILRRQLELKLIFDLFTALISFIYLNHQKKQILLFIINKI